jgi:hypothetical protein
MVVLSKGADDHEIFQRSSQKVRQILADIRQPRLVVIRFPYGQRIRCCKWPT